jgi:hypothetical protein
MSTASAKAGRVSFWDTHFSKLFSVYISGLRVSICTEYLFHKPLLSLLRSIFLTVMRVTFFYAKSKVTTKLTGTILNSSADPKGGGHGRPELQSAPINPFIGKMVLISRSAVTRSRRDPA